MKKYISVTDLTPDETMKIIKTAIKNKNKSYTQVAKNMSATLLFEKPSLRTKLSFQIAMQKLGGNSYYFDNAQIGIGSRESAEHISKVVGSMSEITIARTSNHETLQIMSGALGKSKILINALSNLEHPCQALTDLMTLYEHRGSFKKKHIVYIGNANNNVTHSLYLICAMIGIKFSYSSPVSLKIHSSIIEKANTLYPGTTHSYYLDPNKCVVTADAIITDCRVSMGDEEKQDELTSILKPFQVNKKMMGRTIKKPCFLHCLPAKIGKEVTKEIFDSENSLVFQEAENRLHTQIALISYLIKKEA